MEISCHAERSRSVTISGSNKYYLKIFFGFISFLFSFSCISQTYPGKYWIKFTDKNNSPYSLTNPSQYLSQDAIDRRTQFGIGIAENDLPVNTQYIDSVLTVSGVTLFHKSKWFNAITVSTSDTNAINTISGWGFVAQVRVCKKMTGQTEKELFIPYVTTKVDAEADTWYAEGFNQLQMLNGHLLHDLGYTGSGVKVAVMDAGFPNVQQLDVFQEGVNSGKINGGYDFSDMEADVFDDSHVHGTLVLSTMASYLPGKFIGTAPAASYWLFVTENAEDEYPIEEDNWVAAAEYADSMGIQIFNTSLGYTTFDDSTKNHTYADMDGNTSHISIAADIAASKGILCVSSAGNSGADSWFYIGSPADADSTLAVGAVDADRNYAFFSSKGPSSDGDVKPNVAAQGWGSWFVWNDGTVGVGSGTSFSSPITAGMAACLWQAHPEKSNMEIKNAIEQSASHYNTPDSLTGYGIPDFYKAHLLLGGEELIRDKSYYIRTFPNPFTDEFYIDVQTAGDQELNVAMYDITGKIIFDKNLTITGMATNRVRISDEFNGLQRGVYAIRLTGDGWETIQRVVKY